MKLDSNQLKAINCLDHHSIIIAGAGCGKTTTLIAKVQKLIESGINVNEILILSFTNETVNNFKAKCKYDVKVQTFHKAAMEFINESYDIADDYVIDSVIEKFLFNINLKFRKKLYHLWYKCKIFNENNYRKFITSKKSSSISTLLKSGCKIVKTNNINLETMSSRHFSKKDIILIYCINSILNIYNHELAKNNYVDFDDIIIKATQNLNNQTISHNYKHILVDEYQDISLIREEFLKSIIKQNNAILTVVGDDWQSIYGFSGSNISLFINFEKEFINTKKFFITNTYRCPKKIINISSKFILKNKQQIRKTLISMNNEKSTIKKIYTDSPKLKLYSIIRKIPDNKSVLILSRNSYDITNYLSPKICYNNDTFMIDNIVKKNIRFMTIHKSKGLEADVVIILNLSSGKDGFPAIKNQPILEKIINYKEPIKYAEERRLFYVALTRTKHDLYLIIDKKNSSIFANET